MTGTLYGVGVGPGDPELITVKALRVLESVPVVAFPAPEAGPSLARAIVAPHLPPGRTEIAIRMPMTADRFPAQAVYAQASEEIAGHLDAGRDVAVLCEGDPFFYGSFLFLFVRMAERHRVEVIPGVSSLTACAAALGMPLAARNDIMTVLPAPLAADVLKDRLAVADAAAIIKVGRHFTKVRAALAELGLLDHARYIERGSLPAQRIIPVAEVEADTVPYFSMILVHRRGGAWV